MKCNFCESPNNSIIFDWTRHEKNNILKCNNCGLVFKEMASTNKEIESFYKEKYRKIKTLPVQTAEEHHNDKVSIKDARDRTRFISENVDLKGKKILEIGSASGGLMENLRDAGAQIEGIELNDEYREYSKELGFNIFNKPVEYMNFNERYDIIVSFHTIEHFVDVKSAVKSIFSALKPNGIFLGEVPNENDWRISIFNNEIIKRFHYEPNHYYYFSPKVLKNYLETCGFNEIRLETVERYNSLLQLKNILCNTYSENNIEDILEKYIIPKNEKDDVRLPHVDDKIESEFNRIFEQAVNSELKGNCLRFVASKVTQ
ncbi:MAG: class I SAM-dependent methyltransferase [Candidatus Methanoperedens sp.]|nr:class I SAM-dependent methyltransferase [Candidatus Methanoperedens sp.]